MDDPPPAGFSGKTITGLFEAALLARGAPPPPTAPDAWEDDGFPFKVENFAGRGASGFVWKSRVKQHGEIIALKLIPFHGDAERFRYRWGIEAAALGKLAHRNLVRLLDHGLLADGSAGWLAMEWIEGACLARLLREQGQIPWPVCLDLSLQACEGLAAIHAAGLVHRDIKPANLLFEKETGRLVVADLGIALDLGDNLEARLTRTLERAATPGYAPPEQFSPAYNPHPAGDQFSLAVTLWELLTGSRPAGAFPRLHTLAKTPHALDRTLRRALDPDPARRFPSIAAFAKALRRSTRWHASLHKPLLIALLMLLPLGLAARHFLAPAPPPAVREVTFPMRVRSGDLPVADGRKAYMSVDLTLQRDGKFAGTIQTFSGGAHSCRRDWGSSSNYSVWNLRIPEGVCAWTVACRKRAVSGTTSLVSVENLNYDRRDTCLWREDDHRNAQKVPALTCNTLSALIPFSADEPLSGWFRIYQRKPATPIHFILHFVPIP